MITKNIRLTGILLAVVILLLIPLVAMQFTNDVSWSAFDFIVAGALLLSSGLACEFVLRRVKKTAHRVMICLGILVVLFMIWAELAVGIFGTPLAGN